MTVRFWPMNDGSHRRRRRPPTPSRLSIFSEADVRSYDLAVEIVLLGTKQTLLRNARKTISWRLVQLVKEKSNPSICISSRAVQHKFANSAHSSKLDFAPIYLIVALVMLTTERSVSLNKTSLSTISPKPPIIGTRGTRLFGPCRFHWEM